MMAHDALNIRSIHAGCCYEKLDDYMFVVRKEKKIKVQWLRIFERHSYTTRHDDGSFSTV